MSLDTQRFPRGALWASAALVGFSLLGAVSVRAGLLPQVASPADARERAAVQPLASRDLRFIDGADGSVIVETMDGRQLTAVAAFSENGFIRGVMRGMARERHMRNVGSQAPFRLTLWADQSLTLTDRETGREVELSAFGATNRAAFLALLQPAPGHASAALASSEQQG